MFPIILFPVDPSLGKFDKLSLADQTLMELLIDGIENNERITYSNEPTDICKWVGVLLSESGKIFKIDWYRQGLEGTIDLQWLPSTIVDIEMHANQLTSPTLDLTVLPPPLEMLYLSTNRFHGSIDLTHLPDGLKAMTVARNRLNGTVNLECLPRTMHTLSLNSNKFEGTVTLMRLPPVMTQLHLSSNNFYGSTDCSQLPESIVVVSIDNTKLEGEFPKKHLFAR